MRTLYKPKLNPTKIAKNMAITHNVTFNVIDAATGNVVQTHEGHNAATNSLLTGIGHYLIGDGVYNQAYDMLSRFLPRYISLGTMGLLSQESDENGLPMYLGGKEDSVDDAEYGDFDAQTQRLCHYISQAPGFGADGYDRNENNSRVHLGLGPKFSERLDFEKTVDCELISDAFPRTEISFREVVPESESEIPKTIDVIYSAMISVGALSNFREEGKDYVFITEAGLWSKKNYAYGGDNGLLAGYRIVPPNRNNWNLGTYIDAKLNDAGEVVTPSHFELDPTDPELAENQLQNQNLLKQSILRVGRNQVVQVIWKIQLGGLEQLGGVQELYPSLRQELYWNLWD